MQVSKCVFRPFKSQGSLSSLHGRHAHYKGSWKCTEDIVVAETNTAQNNDDIKAIDKDQHSNN